MEKPRRCASYLVHQDERPSTIRVTTRIVGYGWERGLSPLPERCRFYRHAQADGNAARLSVKQIYLTVRRLTVTIVTVPANIRIPIMPKGNSTPDFGISASTVSTAF